MSAHAFIAPSSAHRTIVCAASPGLEAKYPEDANAPEAAEGDAAHWAAGETIRDRPPAIGQLAPNGVPVTEEMLEAAEEVHHDVQTTLWPTYGERWREAVGIEHRVQIPRVHPSQCWGTMDFVAWTRATHGGLVLHVWDFKFGFRVVEAFENWQLISYAAGLLDSVDDQTTAVDLRVIQPRAPHREGPVRSWRVMGSDLRGHINRLAMAAEEAVGPNPRAVPTPDGCRDCQARAHCDTLQRAAFSDAAMAGQGSTHDLTPQALGVELRLLRAARARMDARISGLEAQAEGHLRRGDGVPGWAMETAQGRLAWNVPPGEVVAFGRMFGEDLSKPDVITPTQAIKKLPQLESVIRSSLASRPSAGVKLVQDDGSKARRIFSARP